jgi:hypothetical protein
MKNDDENFLMVTWSRRKPQPEAAHDVDCRVLSTLHSALHTIDCCLINPFKKRALSF